MDEVGSQQRLVNAAVSAAFGAWRSQLHVHVEESHVLRRELEKKSEELRQLQHDISNLSSVQQENERLREELGALQSQYASETSRQDYGRLEQERDALVQDNKLKQKTIDSLRRMIKYEKMKSKEWWQHSKSPSSPSDLGRGNSPYYGDERGRTASTSSIAGGVPVPSNQAPLQRPVPPLKDADADANSPKSLAQASNDVHTSTVSVIESASKDILPHPKATERTKVLGGSISFPDIDANDIHGRSFSKLPHMAVHPHSSPAVQGLDESLSPHKPPDQSLTVNLPSDSTTPPSQPCVGQESNEEQLPHDTASDSVEIVSARPVGRRGQKPKIPADNAKLASGPFGSAEERITFKSEPSESYRTALGDAPGLMYQLDESLGGKSFSSPERCRDSQLVPSHVARPRLQIAEDETSTQDDNPIKFQADEAVPVAKYEKSGLSTGKIRPTTLKEIKNNEQVLPRTSSPSKPPSKKRRSNDGRGAAAISSIAEDGNDHNWSNETTALKLPRSASPDRSKTSAYRRLDNLLKEPSPAKHILARPSPRTTKLMDEYLLNAAASAKTKKKDQLDAMRLSKDKNWEWYESGEALLDSVGSQRPQPTRKVVQQSPDSDDAALQPQHEPGPTLLPPKRKLSDGPGDEEPFRSRPLHRLDLHHFKINPQANAGVDYAYTDVIRNQDQRKCLPGCTRPECCGGKFRALAGTLPKLTANSKQVLGIGPSDNASSQEVDDDILHNFLGPGSEEKIRTLTSVARENLLLEAKTKIAADKYGKMHRHAYERPKSPPGFWRTEMPGTQEEVVDRLDAKKREREEVSRRYREAVKGGGRWMFADE